MKGFMSALGNVINVVWRHVAVLVAVALIGAAFVIGFRLGSGPSEAINDHGEVTTSEGQWFTCSMHPQVRLPDPDAKCPICFMSLIPATEDDAGSERRLVLSADAVRLARIETTKVARFFPTADVRLFGKIDYDQTRVARITSYFPGRLDRLFVDYVGVPVRQDDHLAEIYSPDLLTAFEELRQARRAVDESRTSSELVRSTTRQTLRAAREKLRLYGLTLDQIVEAEEGVVRDDHLTIYSPIGGVVTHLAALEGDYVKTGSPIATVADLRWLWLNLEAYESQLPLLHWGQQVTFTVESHPGLIFEGKVSFIEPMVDERTRTASVRVTIDNADGRLKPGMFATATARMRVSASGGIIPDNLTGMWVSPMHPEIVSDSPGACTICGMDLVPAETLGIGNDGTAYEEPLVVPRSAVLSTGERTVAYVEVEGDEPTYEGREIVLGPRAGDFYVVLEGLADGERVVTNGAFKIDSAMQIAAKPSLMTPGGEEGLAPTPMKVPEAFSAGLVPLFDAYFRVQEALADDDFETFSIASSQMAHLVEEVDPTGLVGESLSTWRRAAAALMLKEAPSNIEAARVVFEGMAEAALDLQRAFGHASEGTWYEAYCPMAFDNRGANWLQRAEVVDNPYFGSMMLRCGEIRSTFESLETTEPGRMTPDDGEEDAEEEVAATPMKVPEAFSAGLDPLFDAYFRAQEALADDDFGTFSIASSQVAQLADAVDATGLVGESLSTWQRAAAALALKDTPPDIEAARVLFEGMAEAALDLQRAFGHVSDGTRHEAHCPMAFDNRGANWLQRGDVVDNPYFGSMMLRCGEIRSTFVPLETPDDGSGHEGHGHD